MYVYIYNIYTHTLTYKSIQYTLKSNISKRVVRQMTIGHPQIMVDYTFFSQGYEYFGEPAIDSNNPPKQLSWL